MSFAAATGGCYVFPWPYVPIRNNAVGTCGTYVAVPPSFKDVKSPKEDVRVVYNPPYTFTYVPCGGLQMYSYMPSGTNDLTKLPVSHSIKIEGNLRQCALLILADALKQRTGRTYTYNGMTYVPPSISWGPFIFDFTAYSVNFGESIQPDTIDDTTKHIFEELKKLLELRAFW